MLGRWKDTVFNSVSVVVGCFGRKMFQIDVISHHEGRGRWKKSEYRRKTGRAALRTDAPKRVLNPAMGKHGDANAKCLKENI